MDSAFFMQNEPNSGGEDGTSKGYTLRKPARRQALPFKAGQLKMPSNGTGRRDGTLQSEGRSKMLSFNALRLRFRLVASDFPGIVYILDGVCTGFFGMPISGWRWG